MRLRRQRMMREHPFCWWCGRMLREYPLVPGGREDHPPDMATVDHMYSRMRGRPNPGRTVLACSPCNQWRADEETRAMGQEEVWRRSGRYPKNEAGPAS